MSSRRHGLLAMLIASNFVEIKGTMLKRWDILRIHALLCADVVRGMWHVTHDMCGRCDMWDVWDVACDVGHVTRVGKYGQSK